MSSRSWLPSFIALAAIWGASFLFIKVAIEDLAPMYVAFARCAIGAIVLLAAVAMRGDRLPQHRALWLHLFVSALLLNSVPFALFSYGEQHASSVLLLGFQQKVHRRPVDDANSSAIEQVNRDRHRQQSQTGSQERRVLEVHRRRVRWRSSSAASAFSPNRAGPLRACAARMPRAQAL